ncbi:amine oxidase [Tribonema minus]|uniref:Amine oxidase n=1 Tax=Tribonema minus TaxID=303371 RepID=A0A835Z030_9STRA|nr:amine oxidase [Tribonema minus]
MGTSTSRSAVSEIGADWEPVVATSKGTTLDVAVIGAGVAGLGAAWHLTKSSSPEDVRVTVFEPSDVAGGHAHTIDVEVDGGSKTVPVDTGFMVFNHQNYPNLVGLFKELGVEEESTDMSFAVSLDGGAFEWGSASVAALLARRTNALRPSFWRMLADMARFNREAPALLQLDDEDPRKAMTVGEYLRRNNYSAAFARYYLVPMAAALWSSSGAEVMGFSALTMISFFHNHSMLQVRLRALSAPLRVWVRSLLRAARACIAPA